jgi:hypothetical protein
MLAVSARSSRTAVKRDDFMGVNWADIACPEIVSLQLADSGPYYQRAAVSLFVKRDEAHCSIAAADLPFK